VTAKVEPTRKPRADAERNRQRLLDAARSAFTQGGTSVSLEEVARGAGVGIGTLYRHFPTRDALVVEVYRDAAEKLADAARQLADGKPPLEALRAWLLLFVDYLSTKQILVEALKSMMCDTPQLVTSTELLSSSIAMLMERAADAGAIDMSGIDPLDLLRALYGVSSAGSGPGWDGPARHMVDILIGGLKADVRP
jgi:AcrR family transcriptional regulator